ncbi:MAG: hypothetical protein Q7T11_06655, partial [Deltaproteobacteria bacterium]|nr:hypothetical protein [Deltaproteobacteria bacterium]
FMRSIFPKASVLFTLLFLFLVLGCSFHAHANEPASAKSICILCQAAGQNQALGSIQNHQQSLPMFGVSKGPALLSLDPLTVVTTPHTPRAPPSLS